MFATKRKHRSTKPPAPSNGQSGQAKRDRENARGRLASAVTREIGPIAAPADPARRDACELNFRLFCATYFPAIYFLPFSPDHLKAISKIESAVIKGGLFAFAMPRASGKTVLTVTAGLWAILYGHKSFVCLIGATEAAAEQLLANIKSALSSNDMLAADFPQVCQPIRALENDARRCNGQLVDGVKTAISWTTKRVILPTIARSKASGSIISIAGLTGRIRGQNHPLPDGRMIRPALVIVDDPQTTESAWSDSQTQHRLSIIAGDILNLAGPGQKISGIMPCTCIAPGDLADQILDRQKHPDWQGERSQMVYSFPTDSKLWDTYATLRADSLRSDGDGSEATAFYQGHRAEMDSGAVIGWPSRYNPDELSAVQHAMNLKLRDEQAFQSEYQNLPTQPRAEIPALKPDDIAAKANGRERGAIPTNCQRITAFIDVHDALLYWAVCAWNPEDGAGYLLDYDAHPKQRRAHFVMRDADPTLCTLAPGTGREGWIYAGLKSLCTDLFAREWRRDDGALMSIDRMLIDSGYLPDVIHQFIRASGKGAIIMPSRGVGIGAASKAISEYRRQPGEYLGHNWMIPKPTGPRELRHVRFDSNFWKSWLHNRLALPAGDSGGFTLFGKPGDHRLYSEHLCAEFRVPVEGRGRRLDEWRTRPSHPDNHELDCTAGCCVGASMCGIGNPAAAPRRKPERPRPKVTYL